MDRFGRLRRAGLFEAIVEPGGTSLVLAASGPLRVRAIGRGKSTLVKTPPLPLGQQERVELGDARQPLASGEALFVYGTSRLAEEEPSGLDELEDDLSQALQASIDLPAAKLAELAGSLVHKHPSAGGADYVVAVIKRRR